MAYDEAARRDRSAPEPSAPQQPPLEQSWDDTDRGWGDLEPEDDYLERLTRERPPHHGE